MITKRVLPIVLLASVIMLALDTSAPLADSPPPTMPGVTIPYPGHLTDAEGEPAADGTYTFAFALYNAETGGEPLWSEVQEDVAVQGGAFNIALGGVNAIPAETLNGGEHWLAVSVRGPGEIEFTVLTPRQRLSTAASVAPASPSAGPACEHDHFGEAWSGTGTDGLYVHTDGYVGLLGWSDSYIGVTGISTPYTFAWPSERKFGVFGYSYSDHGVYGRTNGDWGYISGVYGEASKAHAHGVSGWNTGGGIGVYGYSESGRAGYFAGPVEVTGYLYKTGGGFRIDHPLDPANKYLNHSFVESPDMKNVYDGVAVLDANGQVWVDLPEWFEALNKDFRYQLTPIGGPGPNLYIAQEVQDNCFQIAGGTPGLKVSWQVTGIRHDLYAEAHPIPVEEDKPAEERGTYLHPVEHGQPETSGVDYQQNRNTSSNGGEP